MRFSAKVASIVDISCDALVVNLFEGVKEPGGATGAVNRALEGAIAALISEEKFEGKLGQIAVIHTFGKIPARKVILVGLGKKEKFSLDVIRRASGSAAKRARELAANKVSSTLHGAGVGGLSARDCAQVIVEGTLLATYKYDKYKTTNKDDKKIDEFEIVEIDKEKMPMIENGIKIGEIIAQSVMLARDLVNSPANELTPTLMADLASEIAKQKALDCKILDREEMEKLGMNAFLGVARGSSQPPKFIIISYRPQMECKMKIAIIGKALTFDSGGLDIKTAEGMEKMKEDMSGAAAMFGIMNALPDLKIQAEVIGIAAATENMPGGNAVKPGDILKAMNGKTIEVANTDAEGRVTLADALSYAVKEKVDEIIDLATLTGACMVALGLEASGVMGNSKKLIGEILSSAEKAGEKMWELPLFDDYKELNKSDIADIKNTGGRWGGAITAALFLSEFVEKTPWIHIDIAGPSFSDKDNFYTPKGGTGVGVRTVLYYLLSINES